MLKKLLLLLTFVAQPLSLFGHIVSLGYAVVKNKKGEDVTIVLLGDEHSLGSQNQNEVKKDKAHQGIMKKMLKKWKDKKTLFLLEANESFKSLYEKTSRLKGFNSDLIHMLIFQSLEDGNNLLKFEWCDNRTCSMAEMFAKTGNDNNNNNLDNHSLIKKDLIYIYGEIGKFLESLNQNNPVRSFFEQDRIKLSKIITALHKGILDISKIPAFFARNLADIGYNMAIEKNIEQHNRIVLFVGSDHLDGVRSYLGIKGAQISPVDIENMAYSDLESALEKAFELNEDKLIKKPDVSLWACDTAGFLRNAFPQYAWIYDSYSSE